MGMVAHTLPSVASTLLPTISQFRQPFSLRDHGTVIGLLAARGTNQNTKKPPEWAAFMSMVAGARNRHIYDLGAIGIWLK